MRHVIPLLLLTLAAPGAVARPRSSFEDVVERRAIRESLPLPAGERSLVRVDLVFGPIRVLGHDRAVVEIEGQETVRARSAEALERARREVWLDVGTSGDEVRFVVDGEFRKQDCDRGWDGYSITYDLTLRVPRRVRLDLRTVNDGAIEVEGVHGEFRVANVNGPVTLTGVTGPGDAKTVNGAVRVRFDENPDADSTFYTINGNIELWLQPGLSADLRFKTFNGEARTDFDVVPLPVAPPVETLRHGRRRIDTGSWSSVRAGRGGPLLSFDTFNGDILVRNARDGAER